MKVLNTRVPVDSVSMMISGKSVAMTRSQDNSFIMSSGGPFSWPIDIELTSIYGDKVIDSLLSGPTGTVQGSSQFPVHQDVDTVNVTSGSGGAAIEGTAGSVAVCNVTLEAYSACGGTNVGVGDAQIPGSCCPDGFSCVRQNSFYFQCVASPTAPEVPPIVDSPSSTQGVSNDVCDVLKIIQGLSQFAHCAQ